MSTKKDCFDESNRNVVDTEKFNPSSFISKEEAKCILTQLIFLLKLDDI